MKFIPGLTIGCLLANLASPMGLYDICFGTAATLIACLGMYYVKNVFAEEEFGIEIPDEDVMNFKTVNDIVNYIEEHK